MPKQTINIGSNANDGTGDPLRTAFNKINDNFAELYGDDSTADTFTSPQIITPTITGTATIDNLIFNDSQISTATNANLELNPGGTGTVELQAATNVTGALDVTGAATLDTSLTLATGATITEFATSTSLGTSDTKVPTQNAVKAYVDIAVLSPRIGDLSVIGSTITAPSNGDLILQTSGTGTVRILEDKISLGNQAGETSQGDWGISIGYQAGRDTQGNYGIAIGREAGEISQGTESIAIGRQAGYDQGDYAVHIGSFAGGGASATIGTGSIGIGKGTGTNGQGNYAIAIGYDAQYDGSSYNSIAIGKEASKAGSGQDSIAIGTNAMLNNTTGAYTTAIGYEAAKSNTVGGGSDRAIAIGFRAGYATLHPNSIILNAENAALNTVGPSRFYVAPIASSTSSSTVLQYDSSTKEITYTNTPTISGTLTTTDIITTGSQSVSGDVTVKGTVFSDRIKSPATNANLAISAQGTGIVDVQSPMTTVAQTVNGNITMPDGFIAGLGNIQIYSNTLTSTTNGNINIVANGTGQISLQSAVTSAYQVNAVSFRSSDTVDTNRVRSYSSNADIVVEPQGTGTVDFKLPTQSTVGSAGAASALPATPSGYIEFKINGTAYVMPYYAKS